jgi:homoserine O-acetyltransferase/O-succinyltransferase
MQRRVSLMVAVLAMGVALPASGLDEIVTPKTFTLPNEFVFENGQKLAGITVVYETYGTLDPDGRNAILVLHGQGGTAHAAGRHKPDGPLGWWDGVIGPGKPFDTNKYFVVAPNALAGGHRDKKPGTGTTGPHSINPKTGKPYGLTFPVFTIRDLVRVHLELLKGIGVTHLVTVSGISQGGYSALEFICTFPDFVDGAIPVVARARSSPQHMARHFLQRNVVMNDPDWQGGNYYGTGRYPERGMALASIGSSMSYNNSPRWYENNMEDADPAGSAYVDHKNLFKMEKELMDNATRGAKSGLDANDYLYQSWAVSRQNVGWKRGDYSRGYLANEADGLKNVKAAVLMLPSKTDDSMRPQFAKEVVDILRSMGKRAELHIIDSERGHGGGTEYYQIIPVMTKFIESLPGAKRDKPTTSSRGVQ